MYRHDRGRFGFPKRFVLPTLTLLTTLLLSCGGDEPTGVAPENGRPTLTLPSVSTHSGTPVGLTIRGSDPDGDALTLTVETPPSNGSVSDPVQGAPGSFQLLYTPDSGFKGSDGFSVRLSDGSDSVTGSVVVEVTNTAPVAANQAPRISASEPMTLTLTGSDTESDPLTYTVSTPQARGTLGPITSVDDVSATVVYTPTAGAAQPGGSDSFMITASDGTESSAAAVVAITFNAPPPAPAGGQLPVQGAPGANLTFELADADPDGDPLTVDLVTLPENGTVTIAPATALSAEGSELDAEGDEGGPTATYTPNEGFTGTDQFSYTVSDGVETSGVIQVTVTISEGPPDPENTTPGANAGSAEIPRNLPTVVVMTGSDADGDDLTFEIVTPTTNGILGEITPIDGSSASVLYTPLTGFRGVDGFMFRVRDGEATSDPTPFELVMENQAPAAIDGSTGVIAGGSVTITLEGTDPDGDPLTFSIVTPPTNGSLGVVEQASPTSATVEYTPDPGFTGEDAFEFSAGDGRITAMSDFHLRSSALLNAPRLTSGHRHACYLRSPDDLRCWGDNRFGQIGDGTNLPSYAPQQVVLPEPVRRISAGGSHTCAAALSGAAYCWGYNSRGQLGDGTDHTTQVPVLVQSSEEFLEISAGFSHTCGITRDRRTFCWGSNSWGQLGDGTEIDRNTPVQVDTELAFVRIAARGSHSCALTASGVSYCWGSNEYGQLGIPDIAAVSIPSETVVDARFISVGTGSEHTCGVTAQNDLLCWGRNAFGVLGVGADTEYSSSTPLRVGDPSDWIGVGVNLRHVCGVHSDHSLSCWGADAWGQLGRGETSGENGFTDLPTRSPFVERFRSVAIGEASTCGEDLSGVLLCWGDNRKGQLGDGKGGSPRTRPALVDPWEPFDSLIAGQGHMCQVTPDRRLICWGDNNYGKVGGGPAGIPEIPIPVEVPLPGPVISASAGKDDTCAVIESGAVYCWGLDINGSLGVGIIPHGESSVASPRKVISDIEFREIFSGPTSRCAIDVVGDTYCWGDSFIPNLTNEPSLVEFDLPFTSVTIAYKHICGLTQAGIAYCWGDGRHGKLGFDLSGGTEVPTAVQGGLSFEQIFASRSHTCGLSSDSTVYCWGLGSVTGNGLGLPSHSNPLPIALTDPVTTMGVGPSDLNRHSHSCVITTGRTSYCWGENDFGEVGNGTSSFSVTQELPTKVVGTPELAFDRLVLGGNHTCGIIIDSEFYCWGRNDFGLFTVPRYRVEPVRIPFN